MNLVERFAEAFNRRDVDGLLSLFTEDATYRDLFYGPHSGQPALRRMFERMFREGRDYRWHMEAIVMDAGRAAGLGGATATTFSGIGRGAGWATGAAMPTAGVGAAGFGVAKAPVMR